MELRASPVLHLLARGYAGILLVAVLLRRTRFTRASPLALVIRFLPAAFAPLPAGLAIAVARGDRRLQLVLLALAGAFARIYGHRFRPRRCHPSGDRALRIVTVNLLQHVDNADRVARLILHERPDGIAVQELTPRTDQMLRAALAAFYPFAVTFPDRDSAGLGWWSRHPLRELGFLRSYPSRPLALAVELAWPGGKVTLVAAHPRAADLGPRRAGFWLYSTRRRDVEIALILDWVRQLARPLVLVGDFNMSDQSAAYREVTRMLEDAFDTCGFGFGHTFPRLIRRLGGHQRWPLALLRLDYAFHSHELRAWEARLLPEVGSDHLPVLVSLGVRPVGPP